MAVPWKYIPAGAETMALVNVPCRILPPILVPFANVSSTWRGLKSPSSPAARTRWVSVTVSEALNVSPTRVSSNHFPVSIGPTLPQPPLDDKGPQSERLRRPRAVVWNRPGRAPKGDPMERSTGKPAPGFEQYPGHRVSARPAGVRVRVTLGGEVVADSTNAIALEEREGPKTVAP